LKVLISGLSGFAGGYLARACVDAGDEVLGISRSRPTTATGAEWRSLDLRDQEGLRALLHDFKPDVFYHLAAMSSVGPSWEDPAGTVEDNVAAAINVLESVRFDAPDARVVWVSSGSVYGHAEILPVDEDSPLAPVNPYAVSKTTGDLLAGVYANAYDLDLVRARPFNHAGPGQLSLFVVSALARQAAEARLAGVESVRIVTGNPEPRRDFVDVRDVARAYRLMAAHTERGVYNICSGGSISVLGQIELLEELVAPLRIEHEVDPARVRPHEVMDQFGACDRIREVFGWEPEIPFRQTMLDTVRWWEHELASEAEQARSAG
jgi:GDP-4-dehydro-6-deoxy-D-mannose reductase